MTIKRDETIFSISFDNIIYLLRINNLSLLNTNIICMLLYIKQIALKEHIETYIETVYDY